MSTGPLKDKNSIWTCLEYNDHGEMMDYKVDYSTDTIDLDGKNYSQKTYEDTLVESGAVCTRGSPTGPVSNKGVGIVSQYRHRCF